MNEDVPAPDKYMEVYISLTKDVDAHASEAWKDRWIKACPSSYMDLLYGNNGQSELALASVHMLYPSIMVSKSIFSVL